MVRVNRIHIAHMYIVQAMYEILSEKKSEEKRIEDIFQLKIDVQFFPFNLNLIPFFMVYQFFLFLRRKWNVRLEISAHVSISLFSVVYVFFLCSFKFAYTFA